MQEQKRNVRDGGKKEEPQGIAPQVLGVGISFRDKKTHDWRGDSPNEPHFPGKREGSRQKISRRMVNYHGCHGDRLELVCIQSVRNPVHLHSFPARRSAGDLIPLLLYKKEKPFARKAAHKPEKERKQ